MDRLEVSLLCQRLGALAVPGHSGPKPAADRTLVKDGVNLWSRSRSHRCRELKRGRVWEPTSGQDVVVGPKDK
jgi:hypothetical protein